MSSEKVRQWILLSAAFASPYMEFFEDLVLIQAPADCVPRICKR